MLMILEIGVTPLADQSPCLARIRAEYRALPGMCLTKAQMQRLWGLDARTCDALVEALEAEHFLKRAADLYVISEPRAARLRT